MQSLSASTISSDPYRAGLELANSLVECSPEVVFLFSTVHYADSEELIEGLYDGFNNEELLVIGNTGDGYYETEGAGDIGAAALGLNSNNQVNWYITFKEGVSQDPVGTIESLLSEVNNACQGRQPELMFLISDFHADASEIETVIASKIHVPVIGGFAADDNQMKQCTLYCNRKRIRDAVVLLVASGPLNYSISIGNSISPVGKPGVIDEAKGTHIFKIDGTDAMDFIERETGKPVLHSDSGVTSLTILDSESSNIKRLRSIVPQFSKSQRNIGLYGGIESGKMVQVCLAEPDQIINEVYEIAKKEKARGLNPVAAIIVSCAGRKWLLKEGIHHEIKALVDQFGNKLPIVGFPSFGEIGPLKTETGYSRNLFHNMTYVLLMVYE